MNEEITTIEKNNTWELGICLIEKMLTILNGLTKENTKKMEQSKSTKHG